MVAASGHGHHMEGLDRIYYILVYTQIGLFIQEVSHSSSMLPISSASCTTKSSTWDCKAVVFLVLLDDEFMSTLIGLLDGDVLLVKVDDVY